MTQEEIVHVPTIINPHRHRHVEVEPSVDDQSGASGELKGDGYGFQETASEELKGDRTSALG
eukprot:12027991-Heterocapsa_arctica.AAC.1